MTGRDYAVTRDGARKARLRVLEEALTVALSKDMFDPRVRKAVEGVLRGDSKAIAQVRQWFAEDPMSEKPTSSRETS